MLTRALGALLCALGLAAIALAVASATVWRPADTLVATATAEPGHPLVVTDPGVLDLAADEVTLVASVTDGSVVALSLAPTHDVEAWVGDEPHTRVTGLADVETLATQQRVDDPVAGEQPRPGTPDGPDGEAGTEPAEDPEGQAGDEEESTRASDPRGSDLWVQTLTGEGEVTLEWVDQPGRWSVLVSAPETDELPTVSLTWPQEVRTPFLVPGLLTGAVLLLGGLLLLLVPVLVRRRGGGRAPAAAVPAAATGSAGSAGAAGPAGAALTRRELRLRQQQAAHGGPPVDDGSGQPVTGRQDVDEQDRHRTAPGPASQAGTVHEGQVRGGTVQDGTVQDGTVQDGTVQDGTVQQDGDPVQDGTPQQDGDPAQDQAGQDQAGQDRAPQDRAPQDRAGQARGAEPTPDGPGRATGTDGPSAEGHGGPRPDGGAAPAAGAGAAGASWRRTWGLTPVAGDADGAGGTDEPDDPAGRDEEEKR